MKNKAELRNIPKERKEGKECWAQREKKIYRREGNVMTLKYMEVT